MNMIGKTPGEAQDAYAMPELQETFAAEVDLASRWLGGSVLAASDESFGEKESLLTPTPSAFVPGNYGPRGEIVDGWETRRRREPGHDWALIRLGAAGIITAVDVDTSFFTGNFPTTCLIEACGVEGYPSPKALQSLDTEWIEIASRSPLKGDAHNRFDVSDRRRFTHVRLSAFPDGGIARLRVYGHVVPDPRIFDGLTVDLASQDHGGQVVTSSDGFYTSAAMLNRPDKARNMGDGWETRRRRDDGNDHAIIRLALPGRVRLVEIDTAHFKYNASAEVALYGAPGEGMPQADSDAWAPMLSRRSLQPDTRHVFMLPAGASPISFVRLDAFPDGGISRIRLWGAVYPAARCEAGYRWFNALPAEQARYVLLEQGASADLAARLTAARPLTRDPIGRFAGGAASDAATLATVKAMLDGDTP
ncbi:allantoicase [Mesorhizobium sp. MSK_1335]|uniref:Probable allantoicase n=1 Tax=Mesorhizobium montanum TaxID=3072323 RepID=A0ABU4ZS62_9HYPH|nr:allantoicase [Mesorhizobium sp. MSK_1335]MDX8528243.1 allantoicase [Mesorhizobium sp. MSK_1335]